MIKRVAMTATLLLLCLPLAGWSDFDLYPANNCRGDSYTKTGYYNVIGALRCSTPYSNCTVECPIVGTSTHKPSTLQGVDVDVQNKTGGTIHARVCVASYYSSAYTCTVGKQTSTVSGYQTISFSSSDLSGVRTAGQFDRLEVTVVLGNSDEYLSYEAYWD